MVNHALKLKLRLKYFKTETEYINELARFNGHQEQMIDQLLSQIWRKINNQSSLDNNTHLINHSDKKQSFFLKESNFPKTYQQNKK